MHPAAKLAKDAVEKYVREGEIPHPCEFTPEMREQGGVFVTIHRQEQLRGCIGTFLPTQSNVAEEIIHNAISSATRDYRFMPVIPDEFPELTYKVDILSRPEPVGSKEELDPKRYGILVECTGKRGLLLPDLEGVDSVDKQIEIASAKAGILPDEQVKLFRFQVRRFE